MFTQGLVADLIVTSKPWHLGLVDIDPQALQVANGLSQRMIAATGADIQIDASLERKALLPGSNVVVTTIGVGSRRAWETDVYIPRKYGIFQPVGDTIMAGGISRAMRLVPVMVAIAGDVIDLCPEALFINYANPMSVICWAVRQATGADIVGLCIGVYEVIHELADFICVPRAEVTALAAGINHFTWVYDLRWKGQDAWQLVRDQLARQRPEINPFSWSLFETYGAYPAVNDRHVSEFFPERFPKGMCYGRQLGVDIFSFEDCITYGDQIYEEMRQLAFGESSIDGEKIRSSLGEHSQLVQILEAIRKDSRMNFTANLPNRGAIPNLPADAILELSSVATARGIRPLAIPDFPDLLATPLARKIACQRLTVEAALRGSRDLFIEALLMDGCISQPDIAAKLVDELLEAQKPYLPQF